ncbi:hypothetical protein KUTeg_012666 [Tegillarca granosa]|uniref:Uncharacterized protein n=1 Tax=Tegillarca granosa TaxID=220873 RepID=A0ABQ9F2N2_TEGGR|nr:hypothetical protein KUTeg_012666 [Tegillarca granosa]
MEETSSSVDHGWAWVILTACTLEALLLVGYVRSFGIYFVEFLTLFDTDASSMTLVIMIQTLMASTTGIYENLVIQKSDSLDNTLIIRSYQCSCTPVPVTLIVLNIDPNRVSSRTFMIAGSIFITIAIMVNGFAENIGMLIVSNGILLGIGFGCTHGPATVMVSVYFKKRRGLANGVANLGASVGGFVLPLFIRYLLDSFGLKGSFIILSGIMLNLLAFSGLMRPIKVHSVVNKEEETIPVENNKGRLLQTDAKLKLEHGLQDKRSPNESTCEYKTSVSMFKSNFKPCAKESVSYNNTHKVKLFSSYQQLTSLKKSSRKRSISETLPNSCQEEQLFESPMKSISVNSGVVGCAHPVTFIPPHAKDLGINDHDIALLLSVIGGSDLLGRILTIFIADTKFLKCSQLVALSLFLTGISLNLAPILEEFWSLAIMGGVYGVFAGVYLTLFPVVLINFVGLEQFSSGMGILALFQGAALTVSIPIIGFLRDKTGTYLGPLHLLGTCSLLAAGLLLFEPFVRKFWQINAMLINNI